jgi:hypothetical protein
LRHWIASLALALTRKNHIASLIEAAAAILPCLGSGDTRRRTRFVHVISCGYRQGRDKKARSVDTRIG